MLYPFPSAGPFAIAQDISETLGELRHVRIADVTPVRVADDFAHISHISGDNRQIPGQSLVDDLPRALLISRKDQAIAGLHKEGQAFLWFFIDDQ